MWQWLVFPAVTKGAFQWKPGFSGHASYLFCWCLVYLQVHGSHHIISLRKLVQQFCESSPSYLVFLLQSSMRNPVLTVAKVLDALGAPFCAGYEEACVVWVVAWGATPAASVERLRRSIVNDDIWLPDAFKSRAAEHYPICFECLRIHCVEGVATCLVQVLINFV